MRVRVKGLVFVGFAAAVFATSAMAAGENDHKTVTSKLYVDSKIDAVGGSGTQADPYGDTTISASSPDNKAPSSQNVYKFVTDLVGDADFQPKTAVNSGAGETSDTLKVGKGAGQWGNLEAVVDNTSGANPQSSTDYVTIREDNGVYKFNVPAAQIATHGVDDTASTPTFSNEITSISTKLTTGKAVYEYAETLTNKATSITTGNNGNSTSTTEYPTTGAVYDFVTTQGGAYQPKVPDNNTNKIMFGRQTSSTSGGQTTYENGWGELVIADADATGGTASVTTGYVAKTVSGGVYTIGIDATKIGTTASDITASSDLLATGQAVYSYAQPRVASNSPQVGIRTGDATNGYTYTWNTLQASGAQNDNSAAKNYVTMVQDGTTQTINLSSTKITTTGDQMTAATGDGSGENGDLSDLPTVSAVRQYVAALPASLIPAPEGECAPYSAQNTGGLPTTGDNAGKEACALVLYYDTTAESFVYKWTKMAYPA